MNHRIPRKLKKQIPTGFYCYTATSGMIYPKSGKSYYKIKPCIFYKHNHFIEGYCKLIKCEIMDQVKECGMKYGF